FISILLFFKASVVLPRAQNSPGHQTRVWNRNFDLKKHFRMSGMVSFDSEGDSASIDMRQAHFRFRTHRSRPFLKPLLPVGSFPVVGSGVIRRMGDARVE